MIRICFQTVLLLFFSITTFAQTRDTTERRKGRSPFADTQELTSSDYLASIDRANELMNTTREDGEFRSKTRFVFNDIEKTNSSIRLIVKNINASGNTNIRNQRMYEKVLVGLQEDLKKYQDALNSETEKLTGLKKQMRTVMKDTVFRKMIRDTVIRKQFSGQLKKLKDKFFETDSILKGNLSILNTHKSDNTSEKILVSEALVVVNDRLEKSGLSQFRNECPNLWNSNLNLRDKSIGSFIATKFSVETKAFSYYFSYGMQSVILLLLFTGLLFWGLKYNFKLLKTFNKTDVENELKFRMLNQRAIYPILVITLNIAIVINLYAPALYIEFLHLLLLAALSIIFRKWPKPAYRTWLFLVGIFAAFSFIDLFLTVTFFQRCLFLGINVLCIRIGFTSLKYIKEQLIIKLLFKAAAYLFIGLNILAVIFNLFGRVSLAYTLSLTGIIAITQIVALSVLLRIIVEIFVLQVYTIRLRRGITTALEVDSLQSKVQQPFLFLIVYLWIVVIASNLNLSDSLYNVFDRILNRPNKIGSFSFTIGGIVLFIFIIWIAHLIQQLAAYFFGGIEGEFGDDINKRQVSRLLITRLAVLVIGYMLAIAASGMPIDKITIVLGALGVGVGLGLQSVVSNFVGGVILIFERPVQIGDMIESGTQSGRVKEIGLRTTRLLTKEGAEVIIPNGNILSQNIVNWTRNDNFLQITLDFGLNGTITQQEIRDTVAEAILKVHDVDTESTPSVFFESVAGNKYKVKIRFLGNIYKSEQVISEARMTLYEAFASKDVAMED